MTISQITATVYSYMETAMIVREVFSNLWEDNKLDDDLYYGESDSDTYATLVDIAVRIEDESQSNEDDYCMEDIREKAESYILKEYGKKVEEKYMYAVLEDPEILLNERNSKLIGVYETEEIANQVKNDINSQYRRVIKTPV